MRYFKYYTVLILFLASTLNAQEWVVPVDKSEKLSSFEFTEETNAIGKDIFMNNCKSCHGEQGRASVLPNAPSPDSEKFQNNTDGDLHYKISEGRMETGMLPFKNTLSSQDIWNVISYVRSLNEDYVQEVAKEIIKTSYDGEIAINLTYLETDGLVKAEVTGTNESGTEVIQGADIELYAIRSFGNLKIDEPKQTNEAGIAYFSWDKELPGDSSGVVKLLSSLPEEELYGLIKLESDLKIGVPTYKPSLVAERAMWNKVSKAPIWLIITYVGGVLAVWGGIFYVLLQLRQIYILGKEQG